MATNLLFYRDVFLIQTQRTKRELKAVRVVAESGIKKIIQPTTFLFNSSIRKERCLRLE